MKKNLLYVLLLFTAIAGLYFLMKKTRASSKIGFERRKSEIISLSLKKDTSISDKPIFRLWAADDSLVILGEEKNYFIAGLSFDTFRRIKANENAYNLYVSKDTTIVFTAGQQYCTFSTPAGTIKYPLPGIMGQGLYHDKKIYYFGTDQSSGSTGKAFIYYYNRETNVAEPAVDFTRFFDSTDLNNNTCMANALEGTFFNIGPDAWGYLFYYGGYFLVFEDGKAAIHRTIDNKSFKKFESKKLTMQGYEMEFCKGENDFFYNRNAAADNDHIYVLSAVMRKNEVKTSPIDVYSRSDFKYLQTIYVPLASESDYHTQLAAMGGKLYLSAKSRLTVYNIVK